MGSTFVLMDAIALGCGVYCLFTWLKLLIVKKLFPNGLLVPKEKKISDCSDEKAYIAYIMPPLAATAIVTTAYGVVCFLNDTAQTPVISFPWNLVMLAAVLGCLIWFAVRNSRANREYFGM
ncbi:MAG: hypothetical protein MJ118_04185 [Clostridia bacterium]|nr:hypothetical protein [Clostridia bacterium]